MLKVPLLESNIMVNAKDIISFYFSLFYYFILFYPGDSLTHADLDSN